MDFPPSSEGIDMNRLIWAGLAMQLCAAPAFAQSTPVPANPLPAGTTVPPAGQSVVGDPTKPAPAEPANIVDKTGATPAPSSALTEEQIRNQLEHEGYRQIAMLSRGSDGMWHGSATKDGAPVKVSIDARGNIAKDAADAGKAGTPDPAATSGGRAR